MSGVDNRLDQIVVLPFLDMDSKQEVGGDEDVVLTMAEVEGFSITVLAGSVVHPDGARGPVEMTSSPVKLDRVPMAPPQGSTPLIVGTLQPAGYHFDPPARVCYPNAVGLAPGDVADIFAFHHDIGQFVNIGPGTVSDDGSQICSDPGFGIVQSGWHCVIRVPGRSVQCANCKVSASGPATGACGQEITFSAAGNPGGGTYSWSGGTPVGSTPSSTYKATFASKGMKSVTVRYTCTQDGETRTAIDTVMIDIDGTIYDADTPMTDDISIPLVKNNIKVSAGETVLFNIFGKDDDRKRDCATDPWMSFTGAGPYETKFTVTGDAEWNSAGSGTTMVTKNGINSGNVTLVVKATWDGMNPITVTAVMKDKVPPPTAPDSGSAKDADHTITWTLVKRGHCPTSLTTVQGTNNTWVAAPAVYCYRGDPDVPPAGRPDYENETILESFGTVTALGFTMADLTDAWKTANPGLTTPNQVAAFLWDSGNNGTFVFNNMDLICDQHGGFGVVAPFKATAFDDADGIGYNLPQTYTCGANNVGNADIRRRVTRVGGALQVEINKTAP